MKKYNYKRAKEIVSKEKENGAIAARLYMSGDYFWTAGEIWNNDDGFVVDLDDEELTIGGINGSTWATPMLEVEFDGYTQNYSCHDDGESDPGSRPLWI